MDNIQIDPQAPSVGKTLTQLDLRKATGATVIAIVRNGEAIKNPGPDFAIQGDDILVLLGGHKELDEAVNLLTRGDRGTVTRGKGELMQNEK